MVYKWFANGLQVTYRRCKFAHFATKKLTSASHLQVTCGTCPQTSGGGPPPWFSLLFFWNFDCLEISIFSFFGEISIVWDFFCGVGLTHPSCRCLNFRLFPLCCLFFGGGDLAGGGGAPHGVSNKWLYIYIYIGVLSWFVSHYLYC